MLLKGSSDSTLVGPLTFNKTSKIAKLCFHFAYMVFGGSKISLEVEVNTSVEAISPVWYVRDYRYDQWNSGRVAINSMSPYQVRIIWHYNHRSQILNNLKNIFFTFKPNSQAIFYLRSLLPSKLIPNTVSPFTTLIFRSALEEKLPTHQVLFYLAILTLLFRLVKIASTMVLLNI